MVVLTLDCETVLFFLSCFLSFIVSLSVSMVFFRRIFRFSRQSHSLSPFLNVRFVGLFSVKFPPDRFSFPFSALTDSLSRSVHRAPDENDRPSEQTIITFKLPSVYVSVYISETTRTY